MGDHGRHRLYRDTWRCASSPRRFESIANVSFATRNTVDANLTQPILWLHHGSFLDVEPADCAVRSIAASISTVHRREPGRVAGRFLFLSCVGAESGTPVCAGTGAA